MTASTFAGPDQVLAWDAVEVAAFDKSHEDILVVERPTLLTVADAIVSARVHDFRSIVTSATAGELAVEALAALHIDCPSLAEDIAALGRSFLAQFEVTESSLRVELVEKTTCPKFHCDNVRVRLVTTYHGPATEYIRADGPDDVSRAATGSLVFLKGHGHPTYADRTLHRSPEVAPGERRLCVVLDI